MEKHKTQLYLLLQCCMQNDITLDCIDILNSSNNVLIVLISTAQAKSKLLFGHQNVGENKDVNIKYFKGLRWT